MSYKEQQSIDGDFNTPLYLFNYLHEFFHFELDPCDSGNNWLGLHHTFTKEQDGLKQDWGKYNAFVNPPYGKRNEKEWIDKCLEQYQKFGKNIFILLPAKTESDWFGDLMEYSDIVIFPTPRVQFIKDGKTKNGNNIGSVIFGLRERSKEGINQMIYFKQFHRMVLRSTVYIDGEYGNYTVFPKLNILKQQFAPQATITNSTTTS